MKGKIVLLLVFLLVLSIAGCTGTSGAEKDVKKATTLTTKGLSVREFSGRGEVDEREPYDVDIYVQNVGDELARDVEIRLYQTAGFKGAELLTKDEIQPADPDLGLGGETFTSYWTLDAPTITSDQIKSLKARIYYDYTSKASTNIHLVAKEEYDELGSSAFKTYSTSSEGPVTVTIPEIPAYRIRPEIKTYYRCEKDVWPYLNILETCEPGTRIISWDDSTWTCGGVGTGSKGDWAEYKGHDFCKMSDDKITCTCTGLPIQQKEVDVTIVLRNTGAGHVVDNEIKSFSLFVDGEKGDFSCDDVEIYYEDTWSCVEGAPNWYYWTNGQLKKYVATFDESWCSTSDVDCENTEGYDLDSDGVDATGYDRCDDHAFHLGSGIWVPAHKFNKCYCNPAPLKLFGSMEERSLKCILNLDYSAPSVSHIIEVETGYRYYLDTPPISVTVKNTD